MSVRHAPLSAAGGLTPRYTLQQVLCAGRTSAPTAVGGRDEARFDARENEFDVVRKQKPALEKLQGIALELRRIAERLKSRIPQVGMTEMEQQNIAKQMKTAVLELISTYGLEFEKDIDGGLLQPLQVQALSRPDFEMQRIYNLQKRNVQMLLLLTTTFKQQAHVSARMLNKFADRILQWLQRFPMLRFD